MVQEESTDGTAEKPADTSEKPKESTDKSSAQNGKGKENGKEKEAPAETKKPKKQVKHIDLPVESMTFSLSKADLNAVMEKEVSKYFC